ncbi:hypothetical protein P885DRAFT_60022 [Corynascus similis CBS 632.67]
MAFPKQLSPTSPRAQSIDARAAPYPQSKSSACVEEGSIAVATQPYGRPSLHSASASPRTLDSYAQHTQTCMALAPTTVTDNAASTIVETCCLNGIWDSTRRILSLSMIMNWIPSSLEGTAPQSKDGGGIVSSRIDLGNGEAMVSTRGFCGSGTPFIDIHQRMPMASHEAPPTKRDLPTEVWPEKDATPTWTCQLRPLCLTSVVGSGCAVVHGGWRGWARAPVPLRLAEAGSVRLQHSTEVVPLAAGTTRCDSIVYAVCQKFLEEMLDSRRVYSVPQSLLAG